MWFLRETSYELEAVTKSYGWFHLTFIAITILVLIISLIKIKKIDIKKFDKVLFGLGLFLLITEVYKQLLHNLVIEPESYTWALFPFQLCSVPMYLFLIVPFLKEGKAKNAIYSFMAYYMTMSGLMFYIIPSVTEVLSLAIHSMIWHMILIVVGIILLVKGNYGKNYKEIIPAVIVFIILVVIATTMNIVVYHTIVKDTTDSFSMFYISPYYTSGLAVFKDIHEALGWGALMFSYIVGCTGGVSVIFFITKYFKKYINNRNMKKA